MKKELLSEKKRLEQELVKINSKLNVEILKEELEELQQITDQLNSLFQNRIVEKYGDDKSPFGSESCPTLIYSAMQILDKASVELEREIEDIEEELNS